MTAVGHVTVDPVPAIKRHSSPVKPVVRPHPAWLYNELFLSSLFWLPLLVLKFHALFGFGAHSVPDL